MLCLFQENTLFCVEDSNWQCQINKKMAQSIFHSSRIRDWNIGKIQIFQDENQSSFATSSIKEDVFLQARFGFGVLTAQLVCLSPTFHIICFQGQETNCDYKNLWKVLFSRDLSKRTPAPKYWVLILWIISQKSYLR